MDDAASEATADPKRSLHFIEQIVEDDLASGKFGGRVHTRFPPEPNGYLHIGHAKSICLNFGLAQKYGGKCNLRFDDTNPLAEDTEYVDSIRESVRWLGFEWDEEHYASDYFDRLYDWAVELIKKGSAYVCDLSPEQIREYRGGWDRPGKNSPTRDRSVTENLDLFERMRSGEFAEGTRTLRAKIDMTSPNMNLRDPILYRILKAHHHRTGDKWKIYPTYDYAHGQSDSIEKITHSICTLEFEDHRPLYDWCLEAIGLYHPQQIEFARLNLTHTVMSKRRLLELVREKLVAGWDDPRMPTLEGIRRRGYTPESLRAFCERIGVSKYNSQHDMVWLEDALREHLNKIAQRRLAALRPIKVTLTNYPEGKTEQFDANNNPEDPNSGTRKLTFGRELYIDADDFLEEPPKGFFRLKPGGEVRLRFAYVITCDEVVMNAAGEIVELRCTYDPESHSGGANAGRKVKGTIHWVHALTAVDAEVRLYDHLLSIESLGDVPEGEDWRKFINPESLKILKGAKLEPSLSSARPEDRFQFERTGYFCLDKDSRDGALVFNRAVSLRDSWAKMQKKG
ncbi:MAG TPA: glutamine--tRNA ligase/YqeY domain fusion protein [Pirellulaceae bacterium]|jgi:glutaminyl-tRNA synthetase|nr:glutamine--tRNA ligase/YqeY domain fusion protein [Pirellulaceae bacterium]